MGERSYRVFINELVTVCIACATCGTRVELGLGSFDTITQCPSCKTKFVRSQGEDDMIAGNSVAFSQLEDAIKRVQGMGDLFKFSFLIEAATKTD